MSPSGSCRGCRSHRCRSGPRRPAVKNVKRWSGPVSHSQSDEASAMSDSRACAWLATAAACSPRATARRAANPGEQRETEPGCQRQPGEQMGSVAAGSHMRDLQRERDGPQRECPSAKAGQEQSVPKQTPPAPAARRRCQGGSGRNRCLRLALGSGHGGVDRVARDFPTRQAAGSVDSRTPYYAGKPLKKRLEPAGRWRR